MSASPQPVLLLDRDGTLIVEPEDNQVDSFDKLALVPEVVPALLRLRDAGFAFVMVSNQDGLGTPAFPAEDFQGPHDLLLQILASQGIAFRDVVIDVTRPEQQAPTRKPGTALMTGLLRDRSIDWERSAMVGDRITDAEFARNLGVPAYLLPPRGGTPGPLPEPSAEVPFTVADWPSIAHQLVDRPRTAAVRRVTSETEIDVTVDLDRAGRSRIATGVGFLDHMLDQLAKHGGFSLTVHCDGDLHIDEHHSVEDIALAVGEGIRTALGDKRGIGRYGFTLPMDEAQATAALDLSGRPFFAFSADFDRERVGDLPTEMVEHFWRSFADALRCTLHLSIAGGNTHHQVEVGFKAVARALRQAIRAEGTELPSTKGAL
ncbi:MAG TPA: bifunctional histidinol-phosphatase/imidazoleglycerol-phosphate dehydratase HisB [Ornithinimicrobium sp.]|uniref:bifunctional histidinol-phosphatase/imidazoleglycerol-phosphate dehydratase HisB n=1 Tax=Ornithinimicrobium sp. TaxID=1977084 RepID=UPI002B467AC5|nr:bifunctional histidinol-phosphatase/imidazoleglycerol-phosphate dehydratase HisB [Ornithinimicrobium sp.]HKJ11772.1 bifunctional histidinol-phosphatase/imidazoleglycerol-phosphate dehydratase HisB [Ornithinimicrobium sp.]